MPQLVARQRIREALESNVMLESEDESGPSLAARPLVRERLWAVAPAADGLSADRPVPFVEVAARRMVMPASGHGLRSLIDAAAAEAGVAMDVVVQTNSMRMQKQFVLAGHGWTILPGVGIAEDVAAGTFSAAPLRDPDVCRSMVLATPRSGRTPPAVDVVARELVRQVRAAVCAGRWPSARFLGPMEDASA